MICRIDPPAHNCLFYLIRTLFSRLVDICQQEAYYLLVSKIRFGEVIHLARDNAGLSLRELASKTGIDFTRLSKIEHGRRPAPELSKIRALADLLHLNMADLLVAAGTSREVMEHLLWSERLKLRKPLHDPCSYLPATSPFVGKNAFRVKVLTRDRALCVVALGGEKLAVLSFISDKEFMIGIPPEMVIVYRRKSHAVGGSAENVFSAEVKKVRQLGQVANLVLSCKGFELNTLHSQRKVIQMDVHREERVFVAVQATAIQTFPIQSEEDDRYEA